MLGQKMLMRMASGIKGILVGPTQINTSTASTATAYSNQRKIDRTSNGVLWAVWDDVIVSSRAVTIARSLDNGVTWTRSSTPSNGSGGSTRNYNPNASLFIDIDDYAHLVFKDHQDGYIYYLRGTPNASHTAWTWSAAFQVTSGLTTCDYPDLVAHREGSGWVVHVVVSNEDQARYSDLQVSSSGVVSKGTYALGGAGNGTLIAGRYFVAGGQTYPSIDFHHTGDGKTVKGGTPHLFVALSAGKMSAGVGIQFRKATYSGGSWTWGTERTISGNHYINVNSRWINCLFNGTAVYIGGSVQNATSNLAQLWERDVADTTTTQRVTDGTGIPYGSMTYTANTVNIYGIFLDNIRRRTYYVNGQTSDGDNVWRSAPAGSWLSLKRGYSDNRIEYVYTAGSASPYDIKYGAIK